MAKAPKMTSTVAQIPLLFRTLLALDSLSTRNVPLYFKDNSKSELRASIWAQSMASGPRNSPESDIQVPNQTPLFKPHCSGPLHLLVTLFLSDPLYHMMIRRRNNKSIYTYIYIYIHTPPPPPCAMLWSVPAVIFFLGK